MQRRTVSRFKLGWRVSLCLLLMPACAVPLAQRLGRRGTAPQPADTLALLDDAPLLERDLAPDVVERLTRDQDDAEIRALSIRWAGLEDLIAKKLLEMEATRTATSVATLRAQQIEEKVGTPSDAELTSPSMSQENVKSPSSKTTGDALRVQWRKSRLQSLERAFVDRLREAHQVRYQLPPVSLSRRPVTAFGPARGPDKAIITIVVFSDFTCPYSVQMRRLLQDLEEAYPDELRVVHQDFPVGGKNAPGWALARAGVCAEEQGSFWPLYTALFDGHAHNAQVELDRAIAGAKLNPQKLSSCMLRPETLQRVAQSVALGKSLGVRATPTFFLNGMRITGVMPRPLMHHLIEQEKATASAGTSPKGAS